MRLSHLITEVGVGVGVVDVVTTVDFGEVEETLEAEEISEEDVEAVVVLVVGEVSVTYYFTQRILKIVLYFLDVFNLKLL